MTCLDCLHCKNPRGYLLCSMEHWTDRSHTFEKKVILHPIEQDEREFKQRKLFRKADNCFDFNTDDKIEANLR